MKQPVPDENCPDPCSQHERLCTPPAQNASLSKLKISGSRAKAPLLLPASAVLWFLKPAPQPSSEGRTPSKVLAFQPFLQQSNGCVPVNTL
jgi:hypothetical protein